MSDFFVTLFASALGTVLGIVAIFLTIRDKGE